MTEDQLHVGSVFQISMRNINLKGRSTKGGMIYRFEAEITEDDFDLFRGHDLTGSCFEAMVECTDIAVKDSVALVERGVIAAGKADEKPVMAPEQTASAIAIRNGPTFIEMNVGPISVHAKPYGKAASSLHANGFFLVPAVLEAIGTDAEFLDWVRAQPCAVTGERDYHKDEATGVVTERCDPAHVRTVANGAGTAIKPPYCAIPLVHSLHDLETRYGKSALYVAAHDGCKETGVDLINVASEWMDKQRNIYVVDWASHRLSTDLGFKSMGFVPPTELKQWASSHDLSHWLPAAYK